MQSLVGVDRMMMCGVRATLVLAKGAILSEAQARKALEDQGLGFGSYERREVDRPAAAFVVDVTTSL